MKVDTMLAAGSLVEVADQARAAEGMGFDGVWSVAALNDPFLPLGVAATSTKGDPQ